MEAVRSLEKTVAEWFKNAPHLPVGLRAWLGDNIWWLVVIGVVISVLGLLALIPLTLLTLGLSTVAVTTVPGAYGYAAGGLIGIAWVGVLLTLATLIVTTVLLAMAISPLKVKAKKGWTILFVIAIASAVLGALGNVITFNLGGLLWTAIWAALEAYLLFEIRGQFGVKPVTKPAAKKLA